jgi:transcriptional regulator with XRE-family HTH domain
MTFGKLIKDARIKSKLTDMELAMLSGVSRMTIINTEKGTGNISLVDAMKLATILKISLDKLKYYEEEIK